MYSVLVQAWDNYQHRNSTRQSSNEWSGQLNIRFFHHSTSIFKWMNVLNITILELVIITQIFTFTYIYSYYSLLNNSHHRYLENRKSIKIYLPSQPLACDHVILKLNITLWRFRIILLGQFGS